ncbi:MAG: PIN domain-containing protein [Candidatus Diapherotrites archaeon]|nr:PIN domain-containing protein [Candidatus Diapherotrites archaeon]
MEAAGMVILDSTILIDLLRGKDPAKRKLAELESQGALFYTTQVNVFELVQGIFLNSSRIEEELAALNMLLQRVSLLDVTFIAAYTAGQVSGVLGKKGISVQMGDLLIAGTALANHVPVIVTRNGKDFARIPGIKVETY